MDCSDFRRHHLAYVDDTLPGDLLVAAERHRVECPRCAAHDTLVRRSLLLAHNVPEIEPSADFSARLDARLRAAMAEGRPSAGSSAAPDDGRAWHERDAYLATGVNVGSLGGPRARQAVAAALVLAAVSAGAAARGRAVGGPPVDTTTAAAQTFPITPMPAAPAAFAAAPASLTRAGGPAADRTTGRATRWPATSRDGSSGDRSRDADDLGPPAYIPLPAGALEASALVGPASVGVPVWPAALLAGEAPGQFLRAASGAQSVRLVGLSH